MNPDATSLDRLHDVFTSPPVPWWPPAPGWYVAGGLILFLALVAAVRFFASWQANRYRREALRELDQHHAQLESPDRRDEFLILMATLLKRAALTAFPREQVASLSGPGWLAFLDRTGKTNAFSQSGQWLEQVAYDPRAAASVGNDDILKLDTMVRHWLKHHRVDLNPKGPA